MSSAYRPIRSRPVCRNFVLACIAIITLAVLALLAPRAASAQGYVVVDLGSLGGDYAFAVGLNDQGQVVGEAYLADNTTYHPFLWDSIHGMQDLGTVSGLPDGFAEAINNIGQVVGACDDGVVVTQHGFLWDSVHGMQDLGTAGSGDSGFEAINDAGQICGYYLPGSGHAILHSGSGPLSSSDDLGVLPGGTYSYALGLNNAGQLVGEGNTASGEEHAILWDGFNGMHDLGTLPGGTFAWANDINDSGDVAGLSNTVLGPYHAFVYSGGVMTDLGTLPGYPHSMAFGIDPSGSQVVGMATLYGFPLYPWEDPMHAVLWRDGLIYDLNSLIAPGSGWMAELAIRINAHGQITGSGYNGSQYRAILLDPIVLSS